MPVITRPGGALPRDEALAIVFRRMGEPDDRRIAADNIEAVFIVLRLVGELDELRAGDHIMVTRAGDDDLPQVSRASHYSE